MGLVLLTAATALEAVNGFDDGQARFSLRVKGILIPYEVMSVTAMPGESLNIEGVPGPTASPASLEADRGTVQPVKAMAWRFRAPDTPGRCKLKLRSADRDETVELNVFVLVPAARLTGERLNGYRIGRYPATPLRGNPIYAPPRGFIEVESGHTDIHLTPHFKVASFLSKQAGSFPKYLTLDERLLMKLEAILAELNAAGVHADTLHVMSGYRTPFYNQMIENVPYSMHVFGGAADIFVDRNDDEMMDDLTGDKVVDLDDARFLYDFVDRLETTERRLPWIGGLGLYPATAAHGPFVHVDVRGRPARWGDVPDRDRPRAVPAPAASRPAASKAARSAAR